MDKNVSVTLLELALKTRDFKVYKYRDIVSLGPKSERAQYKERQRDREDGKNKRNRENERGKRSEEGHRGNKLNTLVGKSSGSETSVYHHII